MIALTHSRMHPACAHLPRPPVGGTLAYTAPEVLLYKKTTFKADVFSFGVLLHEICSGEAPNRRRTLSSQLRRGG